MNLKKYDKLILSIIFMVLIGSSIASAQKNKIKGVLRNSVGKTVSSASIVIKNNLNYIISFGYSDAKGIFEVVLPDSASLSILSLEVSCIGYKRIKQSLLPGKSVYDFVLEEEVIALQEVQIKRKPQIISIGDTLSYNVASFSQPEDRSIGDVIRRLPGITVAENGQISYNGKAIVNLFIHGDDLMDGRYGLATTVINKDMIKSIDVMQNYQPVKVLQNKVFTDDVAMNLVLKDENSLKLGGQAMLGAGTQAQYDMALNAILFNKRFKMLNSLQANTSGVDYLNELERLGTGGGNGNNALPKPLLSASTINNPDLPKINYYFNRSGVVNMNNLYNLKSGLQVKSNIQLYSDKNTQDYNGRFTTFLANDTVTYIEQQHNLNRPRVFNVALSATQNKQNYYLNNRLLINFSSNNSASYLNFNHGVFNQYLHDNNHQFLNELIYTPALKNKDIFDLRWTVQYFEEPQILSIDSGLNAEVLNAAIPYTAISQYAKIPTLLNHAVFSYRIVNSGIIKHNYQLGMLNERQHLYSELILKQMNGSDLAYAQDAGNKLDWERDKFFVNAAYSIKKERWYASLSIPFSSQLIRYRQVDYQLNEEGWRYLINPALNLRMYVKGEDYLNFSYSYQNPIGDITNVYRGAILTNYRSLMANNASIQQRSVQSSTLFYNFQRSIIMLFMNAALSYKKAEANTIISSEIDNNIQKIILLPYRNRQDMLSANLGLSKYLFGMASTIKVMGNWSQTRYDQFVNQIRMPFNNYFKSISWSLDSRPFGSSITFDYRGIVSWNKSRLLNASVDNLENSARRIEQSLNIGVNFISNLNLNIEGKNIYSARTGMDNQNYFFLNSRLRYKLAKWNTDLSLDLTNMMNQKKYEVMYLSSNQFALTQYNIRGFMGVLRATFIL